MAASHRQYDFRVRKVHTGNRLYEDRTIPYCTRCKGELTLDRLTSTMRHVDTVVDALSSCRASIPTRGAKFKYETASASEQAKKSHIRKHQKAIRKKAKDRKNQKAKGLDRLNERKKAERAAKWEEKKQSRA